MMIPYIFYGEGGRGGLGRGGGGVGAGETQPNSSFFNAKIIIGMRAGEFICVPAKFSTGSSQRPLKILAGESLAELWWRYGKTMHQRSHLANF